MRLLLTFIVWIAACTLHAQQYIPSREVPAGLPREFRAAWSACVYNIDWPSSKGLSRGQQQKELRGILDKMKSLNMNAIFFQIRPNADAVYRSSIEPWSPWISGTMGKSPGYDPLDYCIKEAHARGIEVHAWFNPFRALPNASMPLSSKHIARKNPKIIKRFKNYLWMDPASKTARNHTLRVMMDVVRRYDIDGLHIDDYFYPYPDVHENGRAKQQFDGNSAARRRAFVDAFVRDMYSSVKGAKPWVRVGISPFGIWQPGYPRGIEAKINAYEHLAGDSRKWLRNGWCDYLTPQLYWRIGPPAQSYTALLSWWRQQGRRPVWPGIATSRINSKEDPGRRADEILKQVEYSRTIGKNWVGHAHWSVKSLMQNKGGISNALKKRLYAEPALVPPMPWLSKAKPQTPGIHAVGGKKGVDLSWDRVKKGRKYAIQVRNGNRWRLIAVVGARTKSIRIAGTPEAIALSSIDAFGTSSRPAVLQRR